MKDASYVYIVKCGEKQNSPIKIGMSNKPESRVSELQTGCPYRLYVVSKIPMPSRADAESLERYLHRKLKKYRMSGEWFDTRNMHGRLKKALSEYQNINGVCLKSERIENPESSATERLISSLRKENAALKKQVFDLERDIEDSLDVEFLGHISDI